MGRKCTSKREGGRDKCYQESARCLSIIIISQPYIGKTPQSWMILSTLAQQIPNTKRSEVPILPILNRPSNKTRRDIRRRFSLYPTYPLLLAAFQKPPPSREDPAQVQVLRYIPDMCIVNNWKEKKKQETNPLHVADLLSSRISPPKKEKNQVIKVRYLNASSCE